jgi:hypothetical protein
MDESLGLPIRRLIGGWIHLLLIGSPVERIVDLLLTG